LGSLPARYSVRALSPTREPDFEIPLTRGIVVKFDLPNLDRRPHQNDRR
jgi:hypothetical protein